MVEFPNQDHFNGDISSGFVTSQDISICLILGTTTPNQENYPKIWTSNDNSRILSSPLISFLDRYTLLNKQDIRRVTGPHKEDKSNCSQRMQQIF